MSKYTFDFLEDLTPELAKLGGEIDQIFYMDPQGVLMKSRLFAEEISKHIAELEGFSDLKYLKQVDRIERLDREGLLTKSVAKAFDTIRYMGNTAVHQVGKGDLEAALKCHKYLFEISTWFAEIYSHEIETPDYTYPPMPQNDIGDIGKLIEEKIAELLNQQKLGEKATGGIHLPPVIGEEKKGGDDVEEPNIEDRTVHGSYLLYQLSKLKESSQEAVENSNAFSKFKQYLHVERPIQKILEDTIKQAAIQEKSQLILLCGSVGDGKSHLLAYMNETHPELMGQFSIHNDATESFDPTKNSLDTLAEVLSPFSDDNIEESTDKLILAINLGILHNFLESDYAVQGYTRFSHFIKCSEVFEVVSTTEECSDSHFKIVSFADYHPYELTKAGPESEYLMKLLDKIVQPIKSNPFYTAFLRDENRNVAKPFLTNYRLLQRASVRDKLSKLIIQTIVQYKYILSTRTLLNFIYDILVPANLEELEAGRSGEHLIGASVIEELESLLPNLLFESADRSPMLKIISQLDPIHCRSQEVDQALIELNNSKNISSLFGNYLSLEGLEALGEGLANLGPFYELTQSTRHIVNTSFVRLAYFLSADMGDIFKNHTYHRYMDYLFAFNLGVPAQLKGIYEETEKAIFAWKGGPSPTSIYIDEAVGPMNIAQALKLRKDSGHLIKRQEEVFTRFKNTIIIGFQGEQLEIDYPLYETIIRVLDGYRPNKKDKEDAIQFLEFVEKLIRASNLKDELIVYDMHEKLMFKLEYEPEFEEFTFKRE